MCVSTKSFMCDNTYPLKCDCQRKGDDGEIRAKTVNLKFNGLISIELNLLQSRLEIASLMCLVNFQV